MCILCGHPGLVHFLGPDAGSFGAAAQSGAQSGGAFASGLPAGTSSEITYLSGLTSNGTVAATSFWTWKDNSPATYSNTSYDVKWGSPTPGTPGGTVTYAFDPASHWTAAEQTALASGLALWSAEANINFVLAGPPVTGTIVAPGPNFIFYRGTDGSAYETGPQSTTTVGSGSTGSHPSTGVYISIDTSVAGFGPIGASFARYGGYPYQTLVHEIGHLMGLGHGGPYNGDVDPATQQFSAYDTRLWTIMSYIDPWDGSAKYYGSYPVTGTNWGVTQDPVDHLYYYNEPTTPMMLDILAAQQLYGQATSGPLASGGQIFGFHTNLTGLIAPYFDFTQNAHPVVTIWDGGLHNTLDLSGWSAASTINLNSGTFSSANGAVNNIGIAIGTIIETAIGGSGNDTLIASGVASTLNGGGGNDTLTGDVGNDTLIGGPGNNTINGNGGTDTVDYSAAPAAVTVNLATSNASNGFGGTDTLSNIENAIGGAFNDTLTGNGGSNTLTGGGGNDIINGGAGADTMIGGIGNDTYFVDNVGDVVIENANQGNDIVYTSIDYTLPAMVESVVLQGTSNINAAGNSSDNALIGNSGNNTLDGKAGNDTMIGGAGNDVYFIDSSSDLVIENPNEGNDIVYASIDYTIGANIESVVLVEGSGNINAAGNDTNNALVGNSGNNTLDGKGGDDTMIGGAGNDIYFIDSTSDLVVEKPNEGNDIVYASIDYTIGANVESLVLVEGAGNINGSGSNVDNAIIGNSGNNVINGGGGHDLLVGNAGNDTFVFARGEANGDMISDFTGNGAAAGDSFRFVGYGTAAQGATFTQVDATHWSINSSDGLTHDVITLQNAASVHVSDYLFV
jgi:Ca2+-binding RTX toxin-like protein